MTWITADTMENIKVETSLGGVPVSAEIDSLTIDWIA